MMPASFMFLAHGTWLGPVESVASLDLHDRRLDAGGRALSKR
jgi:hypothetical protein